MRIALALAACLIGGCFEPPPSDGGYSDPGLGSGWGGGGGTGGFGCATDTDCGGLVCARTGECLVASQVRVVHTLWTVRGAAASLTSCSSAPKLSITFTSAAGEEFGYTPVPCDAGKHTVDKFPLRFTDVQLARETDYSGGAYGRFDASGNAMLDLPY